MLRFGLLSSVLPLALAGGVLHDWAAPAAHCSVAGLSTPVHSAISFTSDPLAATVRVQIVDTPGLADLAIADDVDAAEAPGCGIRDLARRVFAHASSQPADTVIHLSRAPGADYRIYVDSQAISAEQAAALLVAARGGQMRLAGQLADGGTTGAITR